MALAASVAVMIHATGVRCVALVGGYAEGVLVGLHDVEFRAPVSTTLVGITESPLISTRVHSWHAVEVNGRVAAAADLTQIYVKLHGAAEQIRLEVLVCVKIIDSGQEHAGVEAVADLVLFDLPSLRPVHLLNVQSRLNSVDCGQQR